MTVHLHRSITSVCPGGSAISQAEQAIAELDTERTWAFEAPPDVENRLLDDVELSARSARAVPNTVDEDAAEAARAASATVEVATMAAALREVVAERRGEPRRSGYYTKVFSRSDTGLLRPVVHVHR
jgi:hypothetical protein